MAVPLVPLDLLPPDPVPPLLGCPPMPVAGALLLQAPREALARAVNINKTSFVWSVVMVSPRRFAAIYLESDPLSLAVAYRGDVPGIGDSLGV